MRPLVFLSPLALMGCIASPPDLESPEVQVTTDQGVVTCQLYTLRRVLYDRAVTRPPAMTDAEANAACQAEGRRLQAEMLAANPS